MCRHLILVAALVLVGCEGRPAPSREVREATALQYAQNAGMPVSSVACDFVYHNGSWRCDTYADGVAYKIRCYSDRSCRIE